jgi:hypothetical protein
LTQTTDQAARLHRQAWSVVEVLRRLVQTEVGQE